MSAKISINRALKILREFHHLKQIEVAKKLDLPRSVISELESGTRTAGLEIIRKYAEGFSLPMSSILLIAELGNEGVRSARGEKQSPEHFLGTMVFKILNWMNEATKSNASP